MSEQLFELADRLRALRDEKAEAEQRVKELNAEIDEVDYRLSELMADTETQNFTRAGMMFCLTTKTRASATAGRKEELFTALRGSGYDVVELVGVVTNICVVSNAVLVKTALPEAEVVVDASCTASNDPKQHEAALDVMESLQVTVINRKGQA